LAVAVATGHRSLRPPTGCPMDWSSGRVTDHSGPPTWRPNTGVHEWSMHSQSISRSKVADDPEEANTAMGKISLGVRGGK
jgi:hypothetical protein